MLLANRLLLTVLVSTIPASTALAQDCPAAQNLSTEDRKAGWLPLSGLEAKPLWNGGIGVERPDGAWRFEGDCIHLATPSQGGSLYSAQLYDDFDLEFEWKISRAGNSGLKYMSVGLDRSSFLVVRVFIGFVASLAVWIGLLGALRRRRGILARSWGRRAGVGLAAALGLVCVLLGLSLTLGYSFANKYPRGLEYQITDDVENADALLKPSHRSASLYDLFPPAVATSATSGVFHRSRVRVQGNHVEHWFQGQKVVEFILGSQDFRKMIANSKFAWFPHMAEKQAGFLELQNHGDEVWFRSVRIRRLP